MEWVQNCSEDSSMTNPPLYYFQESLDTLVVPHAPTTLKPGSHTYSDPLPLLHGLQKKAVMQAFQDKAHTKYCECGNKQSKKEKRKKYKKKHCRPQPPLSEDCTVGKNKAKRARRKAAKKKKKKAKKSLRRLYKSVRPELRSNIDSIFKGLIIKFGKKHVPLDTTATIYDYQPDKYIEHKILKIARMTKWTLKKTYIEYKKVISVTSGAP